jgi:hypothetical protein
LKRRDHLNLVQEAMNVIWAFTQEHVHGSDDELTLQLLGIRLFNAAAVSIKLALSGPYQKAFVHVRDILETYFLVDFLRSNLNQIAVWKTATKKQRMTEFRPGRIREQLDRRDGYKEGARKAIYDLISENASHATYRMAKRFGHAAIVLLSDFEGFDPKLELTRMRYLKVMKEWGQKYYGPSFPHAPQEGGVTTAPEGRS